MAAAEGGDESAAPRRKSVPQQRWARLSTAALVAGRLRSGQRRVTMSAPLTVSSPATAGSTAAAPPVLDPAALGRRQSSRGASGGGSPVRSATMRKARGAGAGAGAGSPRSGPLSPAADGLRPGGAGRGAGRSPSADGLRLGSMHRAQSQVVQRRRSAQILGPRLSQLQRPRPLHESVSSCGGSSSSPHASSASGCSSASVDLDHFADAHGQGAPTEAIAQVLWGFKYWAARDGRRRERARALRHRVEAEERLRMEREDSQLKQGVGAVTLKAEESYAEGRRRRELAAKLSWRQELFEGLVSTLEGFLMDEAPPPDTLEDTKYWRIVSDARARRRLASAEPAPQDPVLASIHRRFRRLRARLASTAAAAAVAACAADGPGRTRIAAVAAAAAVVPASVPLEWWAEKEDPEPSPEPEAEPPRQEDAVSFEDADGNTVCAKVAGAAGEGAQRQLLLVAAGTTTEASQGLEFCRTQLTLTATGTGAAVRMPFAGLPQLLKSLAALCDGLGLSHNLTEEEDQELRKPAYISPASPSYAFFLPGDPLGTNARAEEAHKEWKAHSPCGSPRLDDSLVRSPRIFSPLTDCESTATGSPSPTGGRRVSAFRPDDGEEKPKKRRRKSLFETVSVGAFGKEIAKLRLLWNGVLNGLSDLAVWFSTLANTDQVPSVDAIMQPLSAVLKKEKVQSTESEAAAKVVQSLRAGGKRLLTVLREQGFCGKAPQTPPKAGVDMSALRELQDELRAAQRQLALAQQEKDDALGKVEQSEKQLRKVAQLVRVEKKARRDHQRLEEANALAEQMADAVATMKLDRLEYLQHIESPTPLERAFAQIASILGEYRAFLPSWSLGTTTDELPSPGSWSPRDSPRSRHASVTSLPAPVRPPPEGSIAMVFTDIQGSTALWEASQKGMAGGLKIHNSLMRKTVLDHNGYEVKTIGDAFMVAFDTAADACGFALDMQESLVDEDWPPELLAIPVCHRVVRDGATLWCGLRVRIGVHYGPAELELNPVTGRADYFGPTINKASRVESAACGGLVAVTAEVLAELDAAAMAALGDPLVLDYGEVQLKGIPEPTVIKGLVPRSLEGRLEEVRRKDKAEQVQQPPQGMIAMVFTDIQSSTKLWEAAPSGMQDGLRIHNRLFRELVTANGGYEVKTIGDAFMVAFQSAAEACAFGLQAQERLTQEEWAADLQQLADCRTVERDGATVWHGLRVRIGVHYGPAELERNPLTNRADYFGPTVNKASRVESAACGGLVAVTAEVLAELDAAAMAALGDPVLIHFGARELKGVQGPVELSGLLPRSLAPRQSDLSLQIDRPAPDAPAGSDPVPHFRAGLRRARATVAHVRAELGLGDIRGCRRAAARVIAAVDEAAEQTQGAFVGTVGSSFVVCWNAFGKRCREHAHLARLFASSLRRRLDATATEAEVPVHIGIASGPVLCGTVGTSRRRFQSVLGNCVELAAHCALHALRGAQFCLLATDTAQEPQDAACDGYLIARPLAMLPEQSDDASEGSAPDAALPDAVRCAEPPGGREATFALSDAGELLCTVVPASSANDDTADLSPLVSRTPGPDPGDPAAVDEIVAETDVSGATRLHVPTLKVTLSLPPGQSGAIRELAVLADAAGVAHNLAPLPATPCPSVRAQVSSRGRRTEQSLLVDRRNGEPLGISTADLVVTAVDRGSAAARAGVAPGMRIVAVNGQAARDDAHGSSLVHAAQGDLLLSVSQAAGNNSETASLPSGPSPRCGVTLPRPASAPPGGRSAAGGAPREGSAECWQELRNAALSPEQARSRMLRGIRDKALFGRQKRWQGGQSAAKMLGQRPVLPMKQIGRVTGAALAHAASTRQTGSCAVLGCSPRRAAAADEAAFNELREEAERWRAEALRMAMERAEDRAAAAEVAAAMHSMDAVRTKLVADAQRHRTRQLRLERELAKARQGAADQKVSPSPDAAESPSVLCIPS
eukprot:TRINITY_DN2863_c1_g1_i1.p1 TRINITY_DN2863_c1_g1~~TRINITY_DN2863_c1_g1_i1.p1  ORF type:complete len:1970 (+),score=454.14 TRINITY_DN2863_c1_g1_i1:75-5912(+)